MENKDTEKLLNERYSEITRIDKEVRTVQKQLESIQNQVAELMYIQDSLEQMPETKPGSEVLVPISSGIFMKAKVEDSKNLIINVGAGVCVGKTVDETVLMLNNQRIRLESIQEQLTNHMYALVMQAQKIEKEISQL